MRYSVWNIGAGRFDYYDTAQLASSSNVEKPDHLVARSLGCTVEQASWPLPAQAVFQGSGPHAQGRVAIHPGNALAGDAGGDGITIAKGVLLAIAGGLAVKYLVPKRNRGSHR